MGTIQAISLVVAPETALAFVGWGREREMAVTKADIFTNKVSPVKGNPAWWKTENWKDLIYRTRGKTYTLWVGKKRSFAKQLKFLKICFQIRSIWVIHKNEATPTVINNFFLIPIIQITTVYSPPACVCMGRNFGMSRLHQVLSCAANMSLNPSYLVLMVNSSRIWSPANQPPKALKICRQRHFYYLRLPRWSTSQDFTSPRVPRKTSDLCSSNLPHCNGIYQWPNTINCSLGVENTYCFK